MTVRRACEVTDMDREFRGTGAHRFRCSRLTSIHVTNLGREALTIQDEITHCCDSMLARKHLYERRPNGLRESKITESKCSHRGVPL